MREVDMENDFKVNRFESTLTDTLINVVVYCLLIV